MNNKFSKYRVDRISNSSQNDDEDEFSKYRVQPKQSQAEQNLQAIRQQHPYLTKIAEHFAGSPELEKAGNIAGYINKAVELSGLPSVSRGFFETGTEMGRGLANLIPGVNIPKQELPELYIHPAISEKLELGGSFGMGLPAYKGYQLAQKGIEALPYAQKIPAIIRNVLAGSATGAAYSPDDRKLGAALGGAFEFVPSAVGATKKYLEKYRPALKSKQYMESVNALEREESALKDLENQAESEFGIKNPDKLLRTAAEKQADLESGMRLKKHYAGEEKMLPGEQLPKEMEHLHTNTNEAIKNVLREGKPNIQELSQEVVNRIEGVPVIEPHPETGLPREVRKGGLREEIGSKYDELENNLPDVEIPVTDTKALQSAMKDYFSLKSNVTPEDKEHFEKLLAPLYTKNKTINGRDFFRAYRSMKRLEGKERAKANSYGISPKDHDEWIARADKTKHDYKQMEQIIEKHFPEGTIKRLHEINHEYSTKVAPLNENPTYQYMKQHGNYHGQGNLIHKLSGTTPGNNILRTMIQGDQNLSQRLLGHEYAHAPEKLLKPDEVRDEYLKNLPQIKELMRIQKTSKEGIETAKNKEQLYKNIGDVNQLSKDVVKQKRLAEDIKVQLNRIDLSKEQRRQKELELSQATKNLQKLTRKLIGTSIAAGGLKWLHSRLTE